MSVTSIVARSDKSKPTSLRIVNSTEPSIPADSPWQVALGMAERGFRVFPLARRTKFPVKGSHGHLDATNDRDAILAWARATPQSNYGIATGNGFIALDSDSYATDRKIQQLGVPRTQVHRSGRQGRHYLFRVDGPIKNAGKIWGKSLPCDIKGDGGFIVGPGSRCKGGVYATEQEWEPPNATDWLAPYLHEQKTIPADTDVVRPCDDSDAPIPGSVRYMLADGSDGKNERFIRVVTRLVAIGWTDQQIHGIFPGTPIARHRRYVGNPNQYVQQKIESARRYVAANPQRDVVDPNEWLEAVRTYLPNGRQVMVLEEIAKAAMKSPTFPLGRRDVVASAGIPKAVVDRVFDLLRDLGLLQVIESRRTWQSRNVYRLSLVVANPDSGPHDLFAAQGKLTTAFNTFELIRTGQATTYEDLATKAQKSRTTVYEHVRRLIKANLVTRTNTGLRVVKALKKAMDVLADKLGVTGFIAKVAAVVAEQRAERAQLVEEYGWGFAERREAWKLGRARNLATRLALAA